MQTFISFVHEDAGVAGPLAAYLRNNGYKVFHTADDWMLHAGEVWLCRIKKELSEAEIVLVLFSRRSVTRAWVHFEAGAAWLAGKLMIPICIGSLRVEDLPIQYRHPSRHADGLRERLLPSALYASLRALRRHNGAAPEPRHLQTAS